MKPLTFHCYQFANYFLDAVKTFSQQPFTCEEMVDKFEFTQKMKVDNRRWGIILKKLHDKKLIKKIGTVRYHKPQGKSRLVNLWVATMLLLSLSAIGQTTNDSIGLIGDSILIRYFPNYSDTIQFRWPNTYYIDTVERKFVVCDTSNLDGYVNHKVYWINGYLIRKLRSNLIGLGQQRYFEYYLDCRKKRLSDKLVIIQQF